MEKTDSSLEHDAIYRFEAYASNNSWKRKFPYERIKKIPYPCVKVWDSPVKGRA